MMSSVDCSVCYLQFAASFHHAKKCIEKCIFTKSFGKIPLKRIPLFAGTELLNENHDVLYNRRSSNLNMDTTKDLVSEKVTNGRSKRGLKELCLENPHALPCLQALKNLRSSNLMWWIIFMRLIWYEPFMYEPYYMAHIIYELCTTLYGP